MFAEKSLLFSLAHFEGPLHLLLHLVQKEEIDLYEIALCELAAQLYTKLEGVENIDQSADAMEGMASLLLLKSQRLLPQQTSELTEEESVRKEILQQLMEYCQFRETAKLLTLREARQMAFFPRGAQPYEEKIATGLDEISFTEFQKIIQNLILQAPPHKIIQEEAWQVAPKIEWLKKMISLKRAVPFFEVFAQELGRLELIVLFLALLELMKSDELKIIRENMDLYICGKNV